MADNQQYIPSAGGNYVDWSRNVTPMIQNWIDLAKYKMQQSDENRRSAMVAMLQSGAMQPDTTGGATSFGGMNYQPLTLEQQLYRSGKGMGMMKDYYDILNTQQDIAKKGLETNTMADFLKTNPQAMLGTVGGIMSVPQAKGNADTGNALLNFFKNRNNPQRQKAVAILKSLGQNPTDENIAQIMSNPSFSKL